MLDWKLIGQYALLFLIDGIGGYFLQSMGYVLAIYAFNKREIVAKDFLFMTIMFSVFSFGIRNIPNINFGYHTILIVISYITLSCTLFKMTIYPTVLATLLTIVSILIFEALTFGAFILLLGHGKFNEFFVDTKTIAEAIRKALMGIPTNIFLVTEVFIIYSHYLKKIKKDDLGGKTGKKYSC